MRSRKCLIESMLVCLVAFAIHITDIIADRRIFSVYLRVQETYLAHEV